MQDTHYIDSALLGASSQEGSSGGRFQPTQRSDFTSSVQAQGTRYGSTPRQTTNRIPRRRYGPPSMADRLRLAQTTLDAVQSLIASEGTRLGGVQECSTVQAAVDALEPSYAVIDGALRVAIARGSQLSHLAAERDSHWRQHAVRVAATGHATPTGLLSTRHDDIVEHYDHFVTQLLQKIDALFASINNYIHKQTQAGTKLEHRRGDLLTRIFRSFSSHMGCTINSATRSNYDGRRQTTNLVGFYAPYVTAVMTHMGINVNWSTNGRSQTEATSAEDIVVVCVREGILPPSRRALTLPQLTEVIDGATHTS